MESKRYYKISEVAEIFDLPLSTLRFWEKKFDFIKPKTNQRGVRYYTDEDIEKIKMVHYLVKECGMTLDGALNKMKANRDGVSKQTEVVSRLREIKSEIDALKRSFETITGV